MIDAISGEIAEEPVISAKSGHIYEKRLILKMLESNKGLCPVTQQPLSPEDLIPVKSNKVVKPRPTTATSIPAALQSFQNEWDALMLETYTLKQQLDSTRQELAHALYQHDAACRVIARLIKERDEARNALAHYRANPTVMTRESSSNVDSMEVETQNNEEGTITESIKAKMVAKSTELSKDRKKRAVSPSLATAEQIKEFSVLTSNNTHSTSPPGIHCLALHPTRQDLALTGGVDSNVILFDLNVRKIQHTYKSHSKRVNEVIFHPTEEVFLSASQDGTGKVWKLGEDKPVFTTASHSDSVTDCSLHATGDYWATVSLDASWAFHDIHAASTVATFSSEAGLTAAQFHPDGLILGTGGVDSIIRVWDMKSQKNVASFEGHTGSVVGLTFSENGYYLATAAEDQTVKLWDLRKLKNFHTVSLPDKYGVSSLSFDYSGTYLLVSGADVRVYVGKALDHAATFTKHTAQVTDAKWKTDAQGFVSVSMDRSVKSWGAKK